MRKAARAKIFTFIFSALAFPASAHAAVTITEIMYDLPGTDSGREWVEITNEGTSAVDIAGYKFFEANTNHGLTVLSGSSVLAPQASAVIVEDQVKFMADNPSFSGVLLKSSFDLSNGGESIGIKPNASAALEDSVSYDASMGGAGDGNSLHRSASGLSPSAPTPGNFSENTSASSNASNNAADSGTSDSTPSSASTAVQGASLAPRIEVDAGGDRTVEAGAGSYFEAHLYNESGVPLKGARFIWNFGNGETREGQSVFYAYPYVGTYQVVLTADAGNGYSYEGIARVDAVPAEVSLSAGSDGSLIISNTTHAGVKLDVSLWKLSRGGKEFVMPRGTIILPGKAVRLSPQTLSLPEGEATLLYPSGMVAARVETAKSASVEYIDMPRAQKPAAPKSVPTNATSSQEPASGHEELAAAVSQSKAGIPTWWLSLLGLAALILLGAAAAWYVKPAAEMEHNVVSEDKYASVDALAREFTIKHIAKD